MANAVYIYTLSDPRNGQIRYVGKTYSLRNRIRGHLNEKTRTRKANWIKQLSRLNLKPVMEVIETTCENGWQQAEMFWISYLRFLGFDLTNLDGGGKSGFKRSEETLRKISIANTGKKRTPEMLKRLSDAHKGIPQSQESKEKRRQKLKGRFFSVEHRKKISEGQRGRKLSAETIYKRQKSRYPERYPV